MIPDRIISIVGILYILLLIFVIYGIVKGREIMKLKYVKEREQAYCKFCGSHYLNNREGRHYHQHRFCQNGKKEEA